MSGSPATAIERLDAAGVQREIAALAEVLIDCVDSGGGVSFMAPLAVEAAAGFWRDTADGVAAGAKVVLAARPAGEIVGSVQLHPCWQPNQPHRCDVAKLLVHRKARRRGIAEALIGALEAEARTMGRWMLMLDTETGGDAERLYRRLGYIEVGVHPDYALRSHGGLTGTTFFYKRLV
jgi:GNAT superfamily N-acetyltransferase